jgi:hypothetical protein
MNDLLKIALFFLIPVAAVLYVNVLCALIAWWSGWRSLAQRFRDETNHIAQIGRLQSARMRGDCGYNNALYVGADSTGLNLRTVWVVPQHVPLLIPWSEIYFVRRKKFLWWNLVTLRLGLFENIPFTISERLFNQIEQAPGVPPLQIPHSQ